MQTAVGSSLLLQKKQTVFRVPFDKIADKSISRSAFE